MFAEDSFTGPQPSRGSKLTGTVLATLQLFRAGNSVQVIARKRAVTTGTVLTHLSSALEAGEAIDLRQFVTEDEQQQIEDALDANPGLALSPAYQALGERFDYGIIRLVKAATQTRSAAR
jgi:ATP-dependent DNA helicase RecQ